MKFDATTAEGVNPRFAFGECRFEIESARETVSKKTNIPMIELHLILYDKNNLSESAFDYLLPNGAWKIKAFCASVNLSFNPADRNSDLESYMCEKKVGTCITEEGEYNDQKKVVIKKYTPSKEAPEQASPKDASSMFDDEIPFG